MMMDDIKVNRRFYLAIGEGANEPAKSPTAAEPKTISPSGIVAAKIRAVPIFY
jgi:hypothetical protein